MADHSVHCAEYLNDPEGRMLADLEYRETLCAEMASGERVPYVDPALRRNIYLLALRMAAAGMLQGLAPGVAKAYVGFFSVIKKA